MPASLIRRAISSLLETSARAVETPRLSIALTVASVMRVTSLTSVRLLESIAIRRLLPLSSSRRVISLALVPTAPVISSALAVKVRTTSAPTPSRVRSTSLAFCFNTDVTPDDSVVSVRSAS